MPRNSFKGYDVLRNRNYRLFWIGQWISLIGTWMQGVTQAWLLVKLSASPFALGLLGAASSAPLLVLVLLGGLVSDRANRRHVLMITAGLSLVQAVIMTALTLAGVVQAWHIIALAGILGAINAFDIPARQSFIIELVGPEHLPNAIALNSTGFNVARVAGPAIGGLLVAAVGEGYCFLINAVSYIAVLIGLWMISPGVGKKHGPLQQQSGAVVAGLRYALARRHVGYVLALVGAISAIAVPYRNFLPDVARTVLGVGAWRYGLLMAAAGVGAGTGGFILAGMQIRRESYQVLLPAGLVLFSLSLGSFALSRNYGLSLFLLVLVGFGGIVYFNASNTLVQLSVEDEYRGRVMSLYTLMHQGTSTFGSLALGLLAAGYGTPLALLAGSCVCLVATVYFVTRRPFAVRREEPVLVTASTGT